MSDSTNKTVAVVFGGRSAEHDVSIITAHTPIIASLQAIGTYNIVPVYISKSGQWYSDPAMLNLDYFQDPSYEERILALPPLQLTLNGGLTLGTAGWRGKQYAIDVVFPALHGTYGEDGALMGVLKMANVPFVGCDVAASAVAMDKVLTKQVVAAEGIPVTKYVWFTKAQYATNKDDYVKQIASLSYPLFVKPVHLGSSIAITKVDTEAELADAIELALHYDNKVLVEEGVQDLTEVTLPILGNDELTLAAIEEPLQKSDFFNFEDKYLGQSKKGSGGVNSHYSTIPASISEELATTVTDYATRTYTALGCTGIARIDLLIDNATNTVFINEVNTLPGSLYQHNWKQAGVSNVALIERLITLAEERHEAMQQETHTFSSSVLQNAGGSKA